jgi:hypothetical protein
MTHWQWAALGAVATILVGLGFDLIPVEAGCHAIADQAWPALQNATTADRANEIIDACGRGPLRINMWLDALAFIPAFSLLLGGLLIALRPPRWLLWSGLCALIVGVIADQIEGGLLLGMLAMPAVRDSDVAIMAMAGTVKMLCLALATFAIGFFFAHLPGWRRWAGFVVLIGSIAAMAAEFPTFPSGSMGLLVAWLVLAAVSVAGAVAQGRRDRQVPPGATVH